MSFNKEELKEQVEEIIKCPICLENLCDPRMLPCSHTYCLKCIKDLAAHNNGQFLCPLRDGTIITNTNIDALPSNRTVRDIVDIVANNAVTTKCCNCEEHIAAIWCRDCRNKGFCLKCYESSHKLLAFSDHRSSESKPPKIITCSDHPKKKVKYWCKENKTLYCSICLVAKQTQHKCELIADAIKEITDRVINKYRRHPLSANPEIELNDMFKKYEENSNLKKSSIAGIFAPLRQMINDRENFIYEKLSELDVQNRKNLEDYQVEFMKKWKRFQEEYVLFNQRVITEDYITILKDHENYEEYLVKTTDEWSDLMPPTLLEFNIEGLDQCLAILKQSLENICVVEQSPYENPQLQQLIAQRKQTDPILNLNNRGLTDLDTIIIAQELRSNAKITTLHLGNNQIKIAGAKRIADFLRYNKILTTLDLWSNQIETSGAQHIADALRNNTTLIELGLNTNNIDNKGAEHLADALRHNKTLIKLSLVDNQIGDEGARNLADVLKNNTTLKELHILQNKEISTEVRTQLEKQDERLF